MARIEFTLNGTQQRVETAPGESLLDVLRERCGTHSPKDGCKPQGQCGCCLALIDGKPKVSCATSAEKCAGKSVVTLEGLSAQDREITAKAFVAAAGLQCGFCIPGIALRAKHLLDENPNPTREAIAKALDVHLCRCTGYVKIIDAI
nr:2Fe-2S iron-sulfur cluster-binding protein [Polyangiaceae bacterium]